MIIKTGRFGSLNVIEEGKISVPQGILGFPDNTEFCLVDPGDDTLILWLQSLKNPDVVFPVLEPKIFKPEFTVRLSAAELRELKLNSIKEAAVFTVLTIPDDVTQMTSNLRAPLVINLKNQIAKQVVLQENEYNIRHPMFKELKAHLITMESSRKAALAGEIQRTPVTDIVRVSDLPASMAVRGL